MATCTDVPLTETVYQSAVASGYVVLFFFLCFFVALIVVLIFVKYLTTQLQKERIREHENERKKTLRIAASSQANSHVSDAWDSPESQDLATNYIGQGPSKYNAMPLIMVHSKENVKVEDTRERSQSGVKFMLLDGTNSCRNPSANEITVLEILGTLFTNGKNSHPPTVANQCLSSLVSSFELLFGFNQEAFTGLLDLMLSSLLGKRRISESDKLDIMTKYEQMFFENVPVEQSEKYLTKMHFVISKLKSEMLKGEKYYEGEGKKMAAIILDLAKFMSLFQKELIGGSCLKDVYEIFGMREYGLVSSIVDKWFSLEMVRFRLNIIHETTDSLLKRNKISSEACNAIMNKYIKNVYETMKQYCKEYEDGLKSYIEEANKENTSNMKQCAVELEMQRMEQRCRRINDIESFGKKAVTTFFMSQNDAFMDSCRTYNQNVLFIDSEAIKQFANFQKFNEKKLTRMLKSCEEDLFTSCQADNVISENDLIQLSQHMTSSLKDFRSAHQDLKRDLLNSYEKNITKISNVTQNMYGILEQKILYEMEYLRGKCLETLHALSNLKAEEMNEIEGEFETAFWSLAFNSYYSIMTKIITQIHNNISSSMNTSLVKDMSFSLEDLVQILKQDKTVLTRASLFATPDPNVYFKIEADLLKTTGQLASVIEDSMDAFSKKLFKFVFLQSADVIDRTNDWQSNAYFSNACCAKETLQKCNTDSRGYTSKLGSSLVKSFYSKFAEIWQSQADFKALKMREDFKSVMEDYNFDCPIYFNDGRNEKRLKRESLEFFVEITDLEYSAYYSYEKHNKVIAVKTVLDANLENELMIRKLGARIETLNSTFGEGSNSRSSESDSMREKMKKRRPKTSTVQPQSATMTKKSKMNALLASSKPKPLKKNSLAVH